MTICSKQPFLKVVLENLDNNNLIINVENSSMKKILIVEDNKDIAKALRIRLNFWGYDVATANDAIIATTTARNYSPDLILMDIGLPGGDGFTLADRFGGINNVASAPIIFITASKTPGLREKARAIGAVDFIEKPLNTQRLMDAVTQNV